MDTKTGLPATLAGFEDRARFVILGDENPRGTTDVEWRPGGALTSRSRISYAGQTSIRRSKSRPMTMDAGAKS
jgi:hypothetical protein